MKNDLISRQAAIDAVKWLSLGETDATRLAMRIGDYLERLPSAQPEQDREFMKLKVRNINGRPYYSITYLEYDDNGIGHDFEGYSSYSLDVISDYLKKYFMPSAQPKIIRCKDCRYWEETMNGKGYCKDMYGFGRWWKDNDFCSRAERREE